MKDENGDGRIADLWEYFQEVVKWVKETFPVIRAKLMKGLPWGVYFNKYGKVKFDANKLEAKISQLLRDDEDINDITNQRGIYECLLSGDERHLSIRRFSDKMARTAYERQKGVCPICRKHFMMLAAAAIFDMREALAPGTMKTLSTNHLGAAWQEP